MKFSPSDLLSKASLRQQDLPPPPFFPPFLALLRVPLPTVYTSAPALVFFLHPWWETDRGQKFVQDLGFVAYFLKFITTGPVYSTSPTLSLLAVAFPIEATFLCGSDKLGKILVGGS
jgi:hypothetical protein